MDQHEKSQKNEGKIKIGIKRDGILTYEPPKSKNLRFWKMYRKFAKNLRKKLKKNKKCILPIHDTSGLRSRFKIYIKNSVATNEKLSKRVQRELLSVILIVWTDQCMIRWLGGLNDKFDC